MSRDGSAEPAASCLCTEHWLFLCGLGAKNICALCQPYAGLAPDPACALWVCLTPCHPTLPSPRFSGHQKHLEGEGSSIPVPSLSPLSRTGGCLRSGCQIEGSVFEGQGFGALPLTVLPLGRWWRRPTPRSQWAWCAEWMVSTRWWNTARSPWPLPRNGAQTGGCSSMRATLPITTSPPPS